jgi:hypothetical protein
MPSSRRACDAGHNHDAAHGGWLRRNGMYAPGWRTMRWPAAAAAGSAGDSEQGALRGCRGVAGRADDHCRRRVRWPPGRAREKERSAAYLDRQRGRGRSHELRRGPSDRTPPTTIGRPAGHRRCRGYPTPSTRVSPWPAALGHLRGWRIASLCLHITPRGLTGRPASCTRRWSAASRWSATNATWSLADACVASSLRRYSARI